MAGWSILLKQTVTDFVQDGCMRMAAALSYYTVFSLPPLLVLLLVLLSLAMDPQDVQQLLTGQVGRLLGPAGAGQIGEVLQSADTPDLSRGMTAALGTGALLFGAVGAFVELQNALNRVWDVEPDPAQGGVRRFLRQRLVSFGMLLTIAFLLLVSLIVNAAVAAVGDGIARLLPDPFTGVVLQIMQAVLAIGVITLLFALLFRYVPDAEVEWRDVLVGAFATALLFTAGQFALGLYLGRSDPGSAFGAAGALALLLIWIYYSAIILFLGAEFTQSWASHRGSGIEPAAGAIRVSERGDDRM
jgi:membrane protein